MLRITKFRTSRYVPNSMIPALEAAGRAADAVGKVPGVRSVRVYLGGGGIVFAGELENYATADRILADAACQSAFGHLGLEYGFHPESDEFHVELPQVHTFVTR